MKSGKVKEIIITRGRGSPRESIRKGFFLRDFGLAGDVHSGPGDKQVTFFGIKGREKLSESPREGLCFRRFVPTVTTEGINLYEFPAGTSLKIGDSIQEISRMRKRCYPECVLIKSKTPCVMTREVVFTRVIESGMVQVGNTIEAIRT
ncbi:MAG: hypothetical protein RAO92_01070 [Candidatus Euphemobacter frigidus]|nr:hypothetical protein [Candidatus Euphemobacter frigidus]MDP8274970.1 hypothetical protein [Candidatus Euphemobacter frigidus]